MATILIATDGSDIAAKAATDAVAVFGADQSYIVMTVIRPGLIAPNPMASFDAPGSIETQDESDSPTEVLLSNARREETEADAEIGDLVRKLRITAQHRVEAGDPGEMICRVAEEHKASAIVVGSHGLGRARHVFVGSVSRHVIEHAPCLVAVLGPRGH